MKVLFKQQHIDCLLVVFLLCISGNPAFCTSSALSKLMAFFGLIIVLSLYRFKLPYSCFYAVIEWVAVFLFIFVAQYVSLGSITVMGSMNYAVKFIFAILLASYLGERFREVALRVMSVICTISLILFFLNVIGVRFPGIFPIETKGESLLIYTQTYLDPYKESRLRNSGMFWEPGAFSGYILITLSLFIDKLDVLWKQHKSKLIILLVALLTTTSTTGYIVFAVFSLYAVNKFTEKKIYSLVLSVFMLSAILISFFSFDFLWKKMQQEVTIAALQDEVNLDISRTGSLIADIQYVMLHPFCGNGLDNATRFSLHSEYPAETLAAFSNGFSGAMASMGIIYMLLYLTAFMRNRTLHGKFILILIVILLLQGEYFLNYPFFMMLPFVIYNDSNNRKPYLTVKIV